MKRGNICRVRGVEGPLMVVLYVSSEGYCSCGWFDTSARWCEATFGTDLLIATELSV